jgi:hypothetical protein
MLSLGGPTLKKIATFWHLLFKSMKNTEAEVEEWEKRFC